MALTISQKSSLRRHLGFPVIGLLKVSPGGATLGSAAAGYRFFEAYGQLEYKMNNLNPDEECRLTGAYLGAAQLTGPQPNLGDTVSLTLSGGLIPSPIIVTATAPAPAVNVDSRINLVNSLAAAIAANTTLQGLGVTSIAPYGTGPFALSAVAVPEIAVEAPFAFSITASGTGALIPQITANGVQLPPSTSLDGVTTTWGYLPILDGLEGAWAGASANLDTIQAAVWKGRANEAGARYSLYRNWVGQLSEFLGIPVNPRRRESPARHGAIRYA